MNVRDQGVIYTFGNIVYLFSLWLLTVITTQVLDYEAVGALTLAMSIGTVVSTIQLYGVRGYQSSDMAFRYTSIEYISARLATIAFGFLAGIVVCLFLGYHFHLCVTIVLFILIKSAESFSDVLFGNIQRMNHLEFAGYSTFFRGLIIISLFYGGTVLFQSLNVALFFSAIGAVLLTLLIDFPIHNRVVLDCGSMSTKRVLDILMICFPLFLGAIIPAAISTIPRIVLERFYGSVILGFYGNVSTPSVLLTTTIPIILTTLLPIYGKAFIKKDLRTIRKIWANTILGTFLVAGICLLGTFLFGRQVLVLVYTERILPYVHYLYYIFISMMLCAFIVCNNTVLVSMHKNQVIALTAVFSVIVCLAISVPVISSYGIWGAILVLMISFGVKAFVQAIWILKLCSK